MRRPSSCTGLDFCTASAAKPDALICHNVFERHDPGRHQHAHPGAFDAGAVVGMMHGPRVGVTGAAASAMTSR